MPRVAPVVPAETDLLCEGCGYTLNGLPEGGNCPECGKAINESAPELRESPEWERFHGVFWATTWQVLFHPTRFFRNSVAHEGDFALAARFGYIQFLLASGFFGVAAGAHVYFMNQFGLLPFGTSIFEFAPLAIATFALLILLSRIAAKLTAWEAAYRGLRLPYRVVLRAMHYHSAHYLPVALTAAATTVGFAILLETRTLPLSATRWYLYTLCGEVILGAAYLFYTYWIAMRNMMYANR